MQVDRTGPLSYDVTIPDRDPSAQRGIIIGILATIFGWLVAQVTGWFVLGFVADARVVSRGFPLAVVATALALASVGLRGTTRRAKRNGLVAVGAIGTMGALLALMTLSNIKPSLPQVRHQIDSVRLPEGFRVVKETTGGDRLCRQGCPSIKRTYVAPANDPDPVRTMVLAMFAQGWEQTSDVPPEMATTAQRGVIFVHLGETAPHTVEMSAVRQS